MSAAEKRELVSVEDYLAGELVSENKHEYRGGVVYAMAGAQIGHNDICGNAFASLHSQLRRKSCRPFNSDNKVRIVLPSDVRFYYPDVSVVCAPNPSNDTHNDRPVVIIEIISESTRRIDEGEKRDAYFSIPTLEVYLIVESAEPSVQVWRRQQNGGFERSIVSGLESSIPLASVDATLQLSDLYENIEFSSGEFEP